MGSEGMHGLEESVLEEGSENEQNGKWNVWLELSNNSNTSASMLKGVTSHCAKAAGRQSDPFTILAVKVTSFLVPRRLLTVILAPEGLVPFLLGPRGV
jgi:hypothetical protein